MVENITKNKAELNPITLGPIHGDSDDFSSNQFLNKY